MKILKILSGATLLACHLVSFSQSDVRCGQPLDAPLRRGAELTLSSLPAGIEVVGTEQEAIHVTCVADDMNSAKDIRVQFTGDATRAKLTIRDDHHKHNNLRIRVEVPRKINLSVRVSAGAVKVDEVTGDKDIEVTAGNITISSTREWDYKDVNASVSIGAVNAQAYGADKGGFFPSFRKENASGEYRLHAHVTTGQIDLIGKSAGHAAEPN
jgi:DUF4097 and DUF4098 domain-containing protein YvlB